MGQQPLSKQLYGMFRISSTSCHSPRNVIFLIYFCAVFFVVMTNNVVFLKFFLQISKLSSISVGNLELCKVNIVYFRRNILSSFVTVSYKQLTGQNISVWLHVSFSFSSCTFALYNTQCDSHTHCSLCQM